MLDVVLQILSVLGIILLVLLAIFVVVILIVLFFPITYSVQGRKDPERTELSARVRWLFGLLRVRYDYPEPGILTAKFLWFTIYDEPRIKEEQIPSDKRPQSEEQLKQDKQPEQDKQSPSEQFAQKQPESEAEQVLNEADEAPKGIFGRILEKIKNIKYTILSIYDKIKRIWENISYYLELLREEDTKLLVAHAKLRICKMIKSIRPRKLRADILFGTGAPDTTGYAYGLYGMLMPLLGTAVVVTPDFQRMVLQGSFQASGHITIATLLWNALRVALDRRLWKLLRKLKHRDDLSGKKPDEKPAQTKNTQKDM